MNPFAFVRAVHSFFDGPVVLAGGVGDGRALRAAVVLGCDLAYMGTAMIATEESRAHPRYKQMLVDSTLDDVVLTSAFAGLPASMLAPSIRAMGLDPRALDDSVTPMEAAQMHGHAGAGPKRWADVWSAGHSVSGINEVQPVRELVDRIAEQDAGAPFAPLGLAEHEGHVRPW